MLRYPSLRAPLDILFLLCCIALTADVLVPEIWGHGKTKDYPLWYWAGQQVLQGMNLYPGDPGAYFEFIYPPLPAVLLAVPSFFGKIPLYLGLSLLNVVAWWMTAQFSHAMAGSGRKPGPWLDALPGYRHDHLRVRHVRSRAAEPHAARDDAVRLLAAAARAALDGGKHVCAGDRDQGVSGRRASLSGLAQAVGGGREHGRLSWRVSVRRCRHRSAASSTMSRS